MGSAEVVSQIQELTTPPTGDSTFTYGIVLPAEKGSYEPQLITGINVLKDRYTARGVFTPNTDKALYSAKKYCDIGTVSMYVVRPDLGEKIAGAKCKAVSNVVTFSPLKKAGTSLAVGSVFSYNSKGYIVKSVTTVPSTIDSTWLSTNCIDIGAGLEVLYHIDYVPSLTIAKSTLLFFDGTPSTATFTGVTAYPASYAVVLNSDNTQSNSLFGWFKNTEEGDMRFGYFHMSDGIYVMDAVVTPDVNGYYTVASDITSVNSDFWTSVNNATTNFTSNIEYALVTETFENIYEQGSFEPLREVGSEYTIGDTMYKENIPYICKRATIVPSNVTQSWISTNFNPVGLALEQTQGLVGWGTGKTLTDIDNYQFDSDEVMCFYGANGGTWTNGISLSITNYLDNPKEIEIPEAFLVRFYYYGALKETYLCSRVQGILDANGESIYVEDVINNRSADLRVKDNTNIASDINPATQTIAVSLTGGASGRALNDADMISALNKLSNESRYPITLMGNGGYSTIEYGKALHTFISARRSGVVSFSLPLSSAISSDPISSYIDFVEQLGISDGRFWLEEFWSTELDPDTGRKVYISPDGLMANVYGKLINDVGLYHAPAGWVNAVVSVTPVNQWDKGQRDTLDLNKINFFKKSNLGTCIFSEDTSLSRPSYLQQKHIVIALYDLIPKVEDALEPYLFQLADPATYLRITKALEPIMELFTMNKGCAVDPAYVITCNTTNNSQADRDAQQCNVWIEYTPLNSIKKIKVIFGLTNGDVTLADIQEL